MRTLLVNVYKEFKSSLKRNLKSLAHSIPIQISDHRLIGSLGNFLIFYWLIGMCIVTPQTFSPWKAPDTSVCDGPAKNSLCTCHYRHFISSMIYMKVIMFDDNDLVPVTLWQRSQFFCPVSVKHKVYHSRSQRCLLRPQEQYLASVVNWPLSRCNKAHELTFSLSKL